MMFLLNKGIAYHEFVIRQDQSDIEVQNINARNDLAQLQEYIVCVKTKCPFIRNIAFKKIIISHNV